MAINKKVAKQKATQHEQKRVVARRTFALGGGMFLATGFLAARLYQIQVSQNNRYKRLSDLNQFDSRLVPPTRGHLLDRRVRILAGNAEIYTLHITPLHAGNLERALANLAAIIEIDDEAVKRVRERARTAPSFRPILVRESLTQRELARLAIRSAYLPGVSFAKSTRRIYPQGRLTGHLTGYVSPVTSRELQANAALGEIPDLATGKVGIEHRLEDELRGKPGSERVEVNALGRPIRVFRDIHPQSGGDVRLTIDIELQKHVSETLRRGSLEPVDMASADVQRTISRDRDLARHLASGENLLLRDERGRITPPQSGAAVVMDVNTGEVVAMVSAPGYDPNLFTDRLLSRDWKRIVEHPRTPLLNRATAGVYAPGSTFKMVVALAALEAGVVNAETNFDCEGSLELGDELFHCWVEDGHGEISMVNAIERSCDIFFYHVAVKTGIKRIRDMAHRLGLGYVTGVGVPEEKSGIIPSKRWKLATHGSPWTPGETVVAGIGQGYVLTTPLQLAVMTARLANRNWAVTPTLFASEKKREFPTLAISSAALESVITGMTRVTHHWRGTAWEYNLPEGYGGMAGKTGTVQVKRISTLQREEGIAKNIDRPWKERDHALFVGYAPLVKPRYAVSVVVEHGGSGGSTAAPIARDILKRALDMKVSV